MRRSFHFEIASLVALLAGAGALVACSDDGVGAAEAEQSLCGTASYEAESIQHTTGGAITGGWNLWSNGSAYTTHAFSAGATKITVVAQGQPAAGVAPHMRVLVGGVLIGTADVSATSFTSYDFNFTATDGNKEIRVEFDNDYYGNGEDRNLLLDKIFVATTCSGTGGTGGTSGSGLSATIYDNMDFTGTSVTRVDPTVNFDWGSGAPATGIGADTFSVRWTGQVVPRYSQTYTFTTTSDDGIRLWVNGTQIINNFTNHSPTDNTGSIALTAGQRYDLKLEYYENGGGALAKLYWQSSSQVKEIVPRSALYPNAGSGGSGGSGGSAGTGGAAGTGGSGGTAGSGGSTIIEPGNPGTATLTLNVRSDTAKHAISPWIYGLNTTEDITATRQTVVRSGGNRWTAYNWENNASNAGSDWQFQNDNLLSSSNTPGEAVRSSIETSFANGAAALLTVPNVDYVAADKNGGGDVRNTGSNYLSTRFKRNQAKKGAAFTLTPDANDSTVYQDEFVNWVKSKYSTGTVLFDLDNEPDLWSSTHAEVHPAAVTYSELVDRNTRFAAAIKDTWPQAKVLGFVSYGWQGYVNLQSAPDAAANGDFTNYYLGRMKSAETAAGKRLVDYLDLHWYPEAQGGGQRIWGGDNSAAVVAARVQAPRSLWDPNYTETSWITQWSTSGPIKLIPRIRDKINTYYPGTQLAFTEWNYGGGNHISGAIASADVLGIFGRESVGVACNWGFGADEVFMRAAFRAYRNFDGAGGQFGDTSISASTTNVETSSVYASIDAANPGRLVIVAINKNASTQTAAIRVAHTTRYTQADVYTLTAAGPNVTLAPRITSSATNAFLYTMPAQSVSVIVPKP